MNARDLLIAFLEFMGFAVVMLAVGFILTVIALGA